MQELSLVGVRVELPNNQPIVLLKEVAGDRYLPIWIGADVATAIAFAQQGVAPPRPLTHDLLKDVISGLGAQLVAVRITDLRDGIFYATLVFTNGAEVSARPSDSVALAVRTGAPIYAADEVLAEAGIAVDEDPDDQPPAEEEVERFREFLDTISPEDFQTGK